MRVLRRQTKGASRSPRLLFRVDNGGTRRGSRHGLAATFLLNAQPPRTLTGLPRLPGKCGGLQCSYRTIVPQYSTASTGHVSWSDCGQRSVRNVDDSHGPESAACSVSHWLVTSDVLMIVSTGLAASSTPFPLQLGSPRVFASAHKR